MKIKIIDLLNKISKGEEVPKKIRIDHWSYKFEWAEDLDNYYDNSADTDLMSALSMSKEELNYGVEIIEEEKKIELPEKINELVYQNDEYGYRINSIIANQNQIIDYLKAKEERESEK